MNTPKATRHILLYNKNARENKSNDTCTDVLTDLLFDRILYTGLVQLLSYIPCGFYTGSNTFTNEFSVPIATSMQGN